MIILIQLMVVIVCASFALIITNNFTSEPTAEPMEIEEQYFRNLRNLLINIAFFAGSGLLLWILVNMLGLILETGLINSTSFQWCCAMFGVIFWFFWPRKLLITPHTNSIMRTLNILSSSKRCLPENQGEVDNAVKYRGPTFGILNIFDKFIGFIETESRKNLKISMKQLRFSDDVGSGEIIVGLAICDSDAYYGNGDTEDLRIQKVEETLTARIQSLVEMETSTLPVLDAIGKIQDISDRLSVNFTSSSQKIELKLGIRVQLLEIGNLNESEEYRKALASRGVSTELLKHANDIVRQAKNDFGQEISMDKALQFAVGMAGKSEFDIRMWSLDAKGLEALENLILGGAGKSTKPKGGKKP
ncbi:MAG: hypothetical protein KBD10_02910 [Candidatus Pacebacteria bacterium]|nr:hypothetical protein [Candidatus Paceibacterota bacterium]